jgi:hypothetical protein
MSAASITSKKTIIILTALQTSNLRYFYKHDNSLHLGKLPQFPVDKVEFAH